MRAIHAVVHGEAYLHPDVIKKVVGKMQPQHTPSISLTPREHEVLEWMATPNTYRQIALQLSVSEETISSHAKNILEKLKQPNRAQAVLTAMRLGVIEIQRSCSFPENHNSKVNCMVSEDVRHKERKMQRRSILDRFRFIQSDMSCKIAGSNKNGTRGA